MLVIHHTDLDGFCAAAIVAHFIPNVTFMPMNYGYKVAWENISPHNEVMVVDFSFQDYRDMERLCENHSVTWIDHHKSAIQRWEENGSTPIDGVRETGRAACELTWEYFTSQKMPKWVELIGRYDVWDHSDPDTKKFQYGMRSRYALPDSDIWPQLFSNEELVYDIVEEGGYILNYIDSQNKIRAKSSRDVTLDGHSGCLLFARTPNSDMFDYCFDPEKHEIMLAARYAQRSKLWSISLYSPNADVIDVSLIAKERGGGGHPGAAGFQLSTESMIELGFLSRHGT